MTTPPTLIQRAWFTLASDPEVASFGVPVSIMGSPSRRVGLDAGSDLVITAKRSDYDALSASVGLPLTGDVRVRVEFGYQGDDLISLGGYYAREVVSDGYGLEDDDIGQPDPDSLRKWHLVQIVLSPVSTRWRDGRGGYLWDRTRNPLMPDGSPPPPGSDERQENTDLVAVLAGAIGMPIETPLPETLDDHEPPAPLDWGACRAVPELEDLLARVGHTAAMRNSGSSMRVVRLSRAGEAVAVPEGFASLAEPYELIASTGVRGEVLAVTSARTRSTIITARDATELEWVWFDDRLGVWLNGPDTEALYPGETRPDDISAFRAGPGSGGRPPEEWARIFRALRVPDGHTPAVGRLVAVSESFALPIPGEEEEVLELGASPAAAWGSFAEPVGSGQFVSRSMAQIRGLRIDQANRVLAMPFPVAKIASGQGSLASLDAIAEGDLLVYFAHESDEPGAFNAVNYYIRIYDAEIDDESGRVVAAPRSSPDLEFTLRNQDVVVIEAPFLRRVGTDLVSFPDIAWLNDSTLDPVAQSIADAHIASAAAVRGVVPLRGFLAIEPGDWGGAVTQVQWDLGAARTLVTLGQHEAPESDLDAAESRAGRSFAAGLSRLSAAGSSAAMSSGRGGSSPATASLSGVGSGGGGGSGGGDPASSSGGRGAERASGAPSLLGAPTPSAHTHSPHEFFAEILSSEPDGPNRWLYAWREAGLGPTGSLVGVDGGRGSALGAAINLAERHNGSSGLVGNGVDLDTLPEGFSVRPIMPGSFVLMRGPFRASTGDSQYLFDRVNAVDGECPEPEAEE